MSYQLKGEQSVHPKCSKQTISHFKINSCSEQFYGFWYLCLEIICTSPLHTQAEASLLFNNTINVSVAFDTPEYFQRYTHLLQKL